MPKITVLMSCYDASQYLSEAIESILKQTYSDYEFLLINDGSTDGTSDILKRYASEDKRIVVIDKKNTGLADSLNMGLHLARGEWIARLDADDVALPDRLAMQISFVQRDTVVALLGTGCVLIDQSGKRIRNYRYPANHHSLICQAETGGSLFPHSSAMFHRETALRIGGYNRRFVRSQDADLWLRMSADGKIACLPELLVKIRKHTSNISNPDREATATTMGVAAIVCHLIRSKGGLDPSQGNDDNAWGDFMHWLTKRAEQESCYRYRCDWSVMKQDFFAWVAAVGRLRAALRLSRRLLGSGYAHRLVQNKVFRSSFRARLADEWLQTHAN